MPPLVLILALLQDADLEALVAKLGHDDIAVREQATKDLAERGPGVVSRLLSLHRFADSPEVRSRAEAVLRRYPFAALARTRPEEPLHEALKETLLGDLKDHRNIPGCWLDKQKQPSIDGS